MPVIPESLLRNETHSVPPGCKSADGGEEMEEGNKHTKKKRYSHAPMDGFAEGRSGDDRKESSETEEEEEGMIGGWSNEEVEGVIDVDVAANEEREHHRQNTVWLLFLRWLSEGVSGEQVLIAHTMMKMMSVLILRICE